MKQLFKNFITYLDFLMVKMFMVVPKNMTFSDFMLDMKKNYLKELESSNSQLKSTMMKASQQLMWAERCATDINTYDYHQTIIRCNESIEKLDKLIAEVNHEIHMQEFHNCFEELNSLTAGGNP